MDDFNIITHIMIVTMLLKKLRTGIKEMAKQVRLVGLATGTQVTKHLRTHVCVTTVN